MARIININYTPAASFTHPFAEISIGPSPKGFTYNIRGSEARTMRAWASDSIPATAENANICFNGEHRRCQNVVFQRLLDRLEYADSLPTFDD